MTDFMVRMFTDYPWFGWLIAVLAVAGAAYAGVWFADLTVTVSNWLGYRRLVWKSKSAVRRGLLDGTLYGTDCAVCALIERDIAEAERMAAGDDPLEYQHPDGPEEGYDWDGPGDDWSPGLAWGPSPPMPAREMASLAEVLRRAHELGLLDDDQLPDGPPVDPGPGGARGRDHGYLGIAVDSAASLTGEAAAVNGPSGSLPGRCNNADCYRYGEPHAGACDQPPTMPAACYPAMGLKDGPAMPPQPWSGLAASLEVLARGDDSPTLSGIVAAELGHDTTEAAVDSMFTRAQAKEVIAMITDTIIPTGETGRSQP